MVVSWGGLTSALGCLLTPRLAVLDSGRFGQVGRGYGFASSWIVQVGVPLASELGCLARALGCFQPQGLADLQCCNLAR